MFIIAKNLLTVNAICTYIEAKTSISSFYLKTGGFFVHIYFPFIMWKVFTKTVSQNETYY